MAGNYVITLLDAAASLLAQAGVERSEALRALAPLARTSLANAVNEGPIEALTGPIERGDAATVAAHLGAMASNPGLESIEQLYRAAGLHTLNLAARGGLTSQSAAQIAALLAEGESIHAPALKRMKQHGEKIAMLTAYDATMAGLLDRAGIDVILVGDSLGMVVLGHDSTIPVTLDDMVHHTRAVSRGARRALIVADMPFLSYQVSIGDSVRNAGRLIQAGAAAVKLEGGEPVLDVVERLVDVGIPVMGHLGLRPQSLHQLGGYRKQARSEEEAGRLIREAQALEQAGAFAIVLEMIPDEVGRAVTDALAIPTIGIGAGPDCDGQVLVSYDIFGLYEGNVPSFVKRFADAGQAISEGTRKYIAEVRAGQYPETSKPKVVSLPNAAKV